MLNIIGTLSGLSNRTMLPIRSMTLFLQNISLQNIKLHQAGNDYSTTFFYKMIPWQQVHDSAALTNALDSFKHHADMQNTYND